MPCGFRNFLTMRQDSSALFIRRCVFYPFVPVRVAVPPHNAIPPFSRPRRNVFQHTEQQFKLRIIVTHTSPLRHARTRTPFPSSHSRDEKRLTPAESCCPNQSASAHRVRHRGAAAKRIQFACGRTSELVTKNWPQFQRFSEKSLHRAVDAPMSSAAVGLAPNQLK